MAMEARLSLRQSQRVVMTPLLQQAIQLLQLSTLELQEVVQKELLENPLLEEVTPDTPETPAEPMSRSGQRRHRSDSADELTQPIVTASGMTDTRSVMLRMEAR